MTKDDVLALLQKREGDCLSGEELARSLSLSRTAVWKAVSRLREEGRPYGRGIRACRACISRPPFRACRFPSRCRP